MKGGEIELAFTVAFLIGAPRKSVISELVVDLQALHSIEMVTFHSSGTGVVRG